MSRADQEKWDARFAGKPKCTPKPPGFISERSTALPEGGRVLDVACGDGAAALFWAQGVEGHERGVCGVVRDVVAADISVEGLKRLERFSIEQGLSIRCLQVDLDDLDAIKRLRADNAAGFDIISVCHFKPSQPQLHLLFDLLGPGGHLLLTTFNEQHHAENGFSLRFCLAPSEFLATPEAIECVLYQSVERSGGFMDDYHFVKSLP